MRKRTYISLIIFASCNWCLFAESYQATILPSSSEYGDYASTLSNGVIGGNMIVDITDPFPTVIQENAVIWQTPTSSPQNLHPVGFYGSSITSSYGQTLAGSVTTHTGGFMQYSQAAIWTGSSHDFINLHPAQFDQSKVNACWNNQQVGSVSTTVSTNLPSTTYNAAKWSNSAESFVNLHPAGFTNSAAYGIYANQQVGNGTFYDTRRTTHALLWQGSAETVINLHPAAYTASSAYDIWNGQQVGIGAVNENGYLSISEPTHALLWSGSAENYVDLHPAGFYNSRARAIYDQWQVGYGLLTESLDSCHALLWSGTAESVIDLHDFLPGEYVRSYANDIDEFGNIVGTAYWADGTSDAVLWQPIPEPSTLALLGVGTWLLKRRKQS